ncbi:hypothetical protein ABRZ68_12020 [Vibrio vulnificus]|uniref:hypothetical protein n=1 Tax=Vibrio vulnificus TaxID=672 RepID=UPI001A255856|nr:hypothetical protein [Vibrio vulnificus]HAS6222314.1 hypothetical protein [Vibrio vulnificus]
MALVAAISLPAKSAFYVTAEVEGESVNWKDVVNNGDGMVPSKWVAPPSLQATSSWIPATYSLPPSNSIILTGDTGSSSTLHIDIYGMQYNTLGSSYTSEVNSASQECVIDTVSLPYIDLRAAKGQVCTSQYQLNSSSSTSPFALYRPVFDISEESLINALKGLPEGVYTASVPVIISYYYQEYGGILTIRNITEVIMLTVNYSPVSIRDVQVFGDGILEPIYDTANKIVSSEAIYDIVVNGYFNNGVVLTMPLRNYSLINSDDTNVLIPYSIDCPQCGVTNLVDNGLLLNEHSTLSKESGNVTSVSFQLLFSYNINAEVLTSGSYSDSITIQIEPGV